MDNDKENYINIEDFAKVELKVGLVQEAELVEGSDKLIKCSVSFGDNDVRTIVSGISKYKTPTELIGNKFLYVTNLKPRMIFGIESQGMLVALHEGDIFSMLIPDNREIRPGTSAG